MIYLANLNLSQNEIQNAVLQPLATAPANPKFGQLFTNSTTSKIMWFNGTKWITVGVVVEKSDVNGNIVIDGVEMSVYTLPKASTTTLGGIKVGSGLSIDANGVLSALGGGTADAVEWSNVLNKPTDLVQDASYVHTDNNYTTTEKNKLAGIASGAEVNVNSDWNATSGDAQILNKPVALSAFTNDIGFITNTVTSLTNYYLKTELYTQAQVNDLISAISTLDIKVVASLPTENISTTTIYLVAKTATAPEDGYDEYIWVTSKTGTDKWEMIGNTVVDLSNYLQKTGDSSNTTASFVESSNRILPVTGDTIAIIVGKIIKYLKDLKTPAFTGDYNDLINKPLTIKMTSFDISTIQTTNSITVSDGTTIVGVMVVDDVTKEIVICDITVNGLKVTATVATSPEHLLKVIITYY